MMSAVTAKRIIVTTSGVCFSRRCFEKFVELHQAAAAPRAQRAANISCFPSFVHETPFGKVTKYPAITAMSMNISESPDILSLPITSATDMANMGWSFCMSIATLIGIYPTAPSAVVKRSVPITPERSDTAKSEPFSPLESFVFRHSLHANGVMSISPMRCSKNISVAGARP